MLARAPAMMTPCPPAEAEAGQDADQQHGHDHQIERRHYDLRQGPQAKLDGLTVADGYEHAQQDEDHEQDAGEQFHVAASIARRAHPNRDWWRLLLVCLFFVASSRLGWLETGGALGFLVQPVAQVLAGLEIRHALGGHRDLLAGARIAAGPRV